eukprot:2821033-Rhodomonas_salina.1
MGLNEEADIQAKKGAAMQVYRSWHETDFGGLVYQDIEDDEAYYRPGVRAKKFTRDFLLKVELGKCKDSVTSRWLLCDNQGRQYLGELWKGDGLYVKRLALFITFQFPVQANLNRNNQTRAMSLWCWWCRQRGRLHRETITHFLCVCPQFDDARTRAGRIFSEGGSAAIEDELGE